MWALLLPILLSSVFTLLSSVPISTNQLTQSEIREKSGHVRSLATVQNYVRSLSYDPVKVWPRMRQIESTLAFCSNPRPARFSVNIRTLRSLPSPRLLLVSVTAAGVFVGPSLAGRVNFSIETRLTTRGTSQVIPGNLQKYFSTNRSPLQCKTSPAHFS